jgi:serpin B
LLDAELVSANNSFGFKLFEELTEQNPGKNVFISPTSIAIALEMTYNGARGETQQAMAEALQLKEMSLQELNQANAAIMKSLNDLNSDVQLSIANSLWANKDITFKPDFMKRNEDFYHAAINNLDFSDPAASSAAINKWLSENTQQRIREIVKESDINMDAVLFLINAVYFKGRWMVLFDEKYNRERDFTLMDGSKKKVIMMTASSNQFSIHGDDGFQAVSLPYGKGRISMYIFLPDRDSSLKSFLKGLDADNWESWVSQLQKGEELTIILPKFKLEYEADLNDVLKSLGMGVAFSPKADFSGISQQGGFIDEVKHKTFLEVNEEGTEAAAATVVKMKRGYATAPVIVDRPFFCVIRDDETGAILFMGSILDP